MIRLFHTLSCIAAFLKVSCPKLEYHIFIISLICCTVPLRGQTLTPISVENYTPVTFSNYFSSRPDFFFLEDSLLILSELNVTLATQNNILYTCDLSKELNKNVRKHIATEYGFMYHLSDSTLYVSNRNNVFEFNFIRSKLKFTRHIQLTKKHGRNIYKAGNKLYFYDIYNYHASSENISSGFLTYDLSTGNEEVHSFPFEFLSLTHMGPNRYLDFYNDGYVVCDPLRYKLYEYTLNHTLKDSISASDSVFICSDVSRFHKTFNAEEMSRNASSYLGTMTSYLDTVDRVWMVHYLDEKTLFVRLTRNSLQKKGEKYQLFHDHVWSKREGVWKLVQVKEHSYKEDEQIEKKDVWPFFFPGSKYSAKDGKLYFTFWSASPNTFPQTLKSFSGFESTDRNALALKVVQFKIK